MCVCNVKRRSNASCDRETTAASKASKADIYCDSASSPFSLRFPLLFLHIFFFGSLIPPRDMHYRHKEAEQRMFLSRMQQSKHQQKALETRVSAMMLVLNHACSSLGMTHCLQELGRGGGCVCARARVRACVRVCV